MKYLAFSVLLILATYIIATIFLKLIKADPHRNTEVLSQDVANIYKGFAICIIMLAHIGNVFNVRFLTPLGSWGVGIFLFLSGYGLAVSTKKKGLRNYWKKRIVTAWLPYAATEIIGIIICATPEYAQLEPQGILLDLLLIQTIHPFGWYMQCLFLYYVGFYLAHRLFGSNTIGRYGVLLVFSIILFAFFRSLFKQQALTFVFGVLIANDVKLRDRAIRKPLFSLLFLVAGVACLLIRQSALLRSRIWTYELVFSLQVLFLTVGTLNLIGWLFSQIKAVFFEPALFLGLISYEIYLYHGWIYSWISTRPVSYLLIAIFFLSSIAVAIPFYWLRSKLVVCYKKKSI